MALRMKNWFEVNWRIEFWPGGGGGWGCGGGGEGVCSPFNINCKKRIAKKL